MTFMLAIHLVFRDLTLKFLQEKVGINMKSVGWTDEGLL